MQCITGNHFCFHKGLHAFWKEFESPIYIFKCDLKQGVHIRYVNSLTFKGNCFPTWGHYFISCILPHYPGGRFLQHFAGCFQTILRISLTSAILGDLIAQWRGFSKVKLEFSFFFGVTAQCHNGVVDFPSRTPVLHKWYSWDVWVAAFTCLCVRETEPLESV